MARTETDPPFDHALVAVCGECSGKDPRPKAVRAAIRHAVRAGGRKRAVRVVETSCLDLCPKKAVAVAVAPTGGGLSCHAVGDEADLDVVITLVGDAISASR